MKNRSYLTRPCAILVTSDSNYHNCHNLSKLVTIVTIGLNCHKLVTINTIGNTWSHLITIEGDFLRTLLPPEATES